MDDDAGISQADHSFLARDKRERKRVYDIYNKEECDFETKEEWDAYLEEREDIILNLVEKIDVEATERRVRQYQVANAANIQENKARKVRRKQDAAAATEATKAAPTETTAAAATTTAGVAASVGAYVPPGMSFAAGVSGAAPVPMQAIEQDAEGRLPRPNVVDKEGHDKMALASGWTDDVPHNRLLHDAFTTMLVW